MTEEFQWHADFVIGNFLLFNRASLMQMYTYVMHFNIS